MELIRIYECLCDATRLRLLNLLMQGPLCVCHFQSVLGEPQVKISKHLGYLRARGMVAVKREGQWMIYRLADEASPELKANLSCLQDCVREQAIFKDDLTRLKNLDRACSPLGAAGKAGAVGGRGATGAARCC